MVTHRYVLAVHGGAGSRSAGADLERQRAGLRAALKAGESVLAAGGSALDAVERAVCVLEDDECFNAGRGSVLTRDGGVEMDAAIMCGATLAGGAVACVSRVVHPVSAARAVMERTPHLLLAGAGAEAVAAAAGLALAEPASFVTEARRRRWQDGGSGGTAGTVGAVALDRAGHLAAATSTGGTAGKLPGRIGDSPLIGAGTWAADGRCAVSATGDGELIARACVAHEIDARLRLAGANSEEAARAALALVAALGGSAGCIAIDAAGAVALPFNTPAMARGVVREGNAMAIAIGSEPLAP